MNSLSRDTKTHLLQQAIKASQQAYAPYSQFKVGAAVLCPHGMIYTGSNIENASYGLTVCAERVAISNAIHSGNSRIEAIAIYAEKSQECYPCGACRQWLHEFNIPIIIIESADGIKEVTLDTLFPYAFGPDHIS